MGDFFAMTSLDYYLGWLDRFKAIDYDFLFAGGSEPCFLEVYAATL